MTHAITRWTSALTVGMAGLFTAEALGAEDAWVDVSSPLLAKLVRDGTKPEWPGGCSGVVVNRTSGEVTVKVVGQGLWRSSDGGENWRRVDGGVVSGRDETGWATTVDQNNPARIASFSLDGSAGWTADGTTWKAFSSLGRNWDYGSVDWATRIPAVIIAAKHETTPPGEVYLSKDGGVSWKLLEIHLAEKRDQISMVGVLDSTTLIYSNGKWHPPQCRRGFDLDSGQLEQPSNPNPCAVREDALPRHSGGAVSQQGPWAHVAGTGNPREHLARAVLRAQWRGAPGGWPGWGVEIHRCRCPLDQSRQSPTEGRRIPLYAQLVRLLRVGPDPQRSLRLVDGESRT